MQWAKVFAVLSGILLLLSTTATLNTFAARQQPVSLSFEMNGCKNDMTCGAEFLIGDMVTFSGTLTTENETPIPGATVNIMNLLPTPELVVIATGVTGIDGDFELSWTAQFTPREKASTDVLKKYLDETLELFAQFEGDATYAETRTGKLIATIKANQVFTSVNSEKKVYGPGDSALMFIGFIDSNDEFVDPDSMRVLYDDQELQVEKKKTGSYTVMTPTLTVDHHQVIVIPKKEGYNLENGFLTVQVSGFFGK
ncbi:MAG: hypothetical protein ACE5J2_08680 [Nitrososphaerales archaeon]